VRVGDARQLPEVLADVAGEIDLIVMSPPNTHNDAGTAAHAAPEQGNAATRDDACDRIDPATVRRDGMAAVYAACHAVLRPGGPLVTVTHNTRSGGRLVDRAAITRRLAVDAGFGYLQHVIALRLAIRNGRLLPHPSHRQRAQLARARRAGHAVHLVAHDDVLVFVKQEPRRG
jgi:modification methylase